MPAFTYVLESLRHGKRYVGATSKSPAARLAQHNSRSNQWTRQNGPFKLLYTEAFPSIREARERERFLKTGVGRKIRDELCQRAISSVSAEGGPASG